MMTIDVKRALALLLLVFSLLVFGAAFVVPVPDVVSTEVR